MNWNQLDLLNRELASLESARLPLPEGLRFAASQARRPRFAEALRGLSRSADSGVELSKAMAQRPDVFPKLYVSLVRAGERGGNMLDALRNMGEFLNMRRRIISAFRSALIYPAFVLTVAVAISWFVTGSLIPTLVENIRATSQLVGQSVTHYPPMIQTAFAVQYVIVGLFTVLWAIALLLLLGGLFFPTTRAYQLILLRLPLYGFLMRYYLRYHFAGVTSMLLKEGVPLDEALDNLSALNDSPLIAEAATNAREYVEHGRPLSAAMAEVAWFSESEAVLLKNAEQQEQVLPYLQELHERTSSAVGRLEQVVFSLEPTLISTLAVAVGTYVIAVLIPLLSYTKYIALGDG